MTYPPRYDANPRMKKRARNDYHPEHDPGGGGTEIVREARICPTCNA